jgi:hypothetical protein
MAIGTKDVKGGTSINKTIAPGNHRLKINNIGVEEFTFIPGALNLVLQVETAPLENFEGFFIDKDNESLGRYEGQIGRVKSGQYAFADGTTKTGIVIDRDNSILVFLKALCTSLDLLDWFDAQDDKHDTIEDFVLALNDDAPYKDMYIDFCVAGKQYENRAGYTAYDLHLPKSSRDGYAFSKADSGKTLLFSESLHIKKSAPKKVDNFDGGNTEPGSPIAAATDFDLD